MPNIAVQVNARSTPAGITVDLSQMRNVTVDPVRQTAFVSDMLSRLCYG